MTKAPRSDAAILTSVMAPGLMTTVKVTRKLTNALMAPSRPPRPEPPTRPPRGPTNPTPNPKGPSKGDPPPKPKPPKGQSPWM